MGCGRPREAYRDAERNPLPTASSLSPCKEAVTRETFTNAVVQLTYVVQSSGSESPWTWPWPWTHKVSTEGADDHQDGRWGRRPVLGPVPSHRPPRIPQPTPRPYPALRRLRAPGLRVRSRSTCGRTPRPVLASPTLPPELYPQPQPAPGAEQSLPAHTRQRRTVSFHAAPPLHRLSQDQNSLAGARLARLHCADGETETRGR